MILKSGDLVVYRPHRAFGVLIRREAGDEPHWSVALRSPGVENKEVIYTRIFLHPEQKIFDSVRSGDLEYYAS